MGVPVLEVKDLSVLRGAEPCSFTLEAGDFGVILSQNRRCRSSWIRALGGLEKIGAGEASVCGFPLRSEEAGKRIGFAVDCQDIGKGFTLRQFLQMFAGLSGLDKGMCPYAASEALAVARLEPQADEPVESFSDPSVFVRMSIARALVCSPRLLLVDDIFSSCIPGVQKLAASILNEVRCTGTAILAAVPGLNFFRGIFSHIAVVDEKKILLHGRVPDVFSDMEHLQLIQIQIADEGAERFLNIMQNCPSVSGLLQSKNDPGVYRFFYAGDAAETDLFVGKVNAECSAVVGSFPVQSFWGTQSF